MPKLNAPDILKALADLPEWKQAGDSITRTYVFNDFPEAIGFVNRIAELAENAGHHPDIDMSWNKVVLTLSTHDEGGLTEKDFKLARQCDLA